MEGMFYLERTARVNLNLGGSLGSPGQRLVAALSDTE
jgi:hypothetical protein